MNGTCATVITITTVLTLFSSPLRGEKVKYVAKCNYIAKEIVQSDGKTVGAGTTSEFYLCLARRNRTGRLDTTFNGVGEFIHPDEAEVHSLEILPSGNYLVKGLLTVKFVLFSLEVSPSGSVVGWAYYPAGTTPPQEPINCSDPLMAFDPSCQTTTQPAPCDPLFEICL